MMTAILIIGGIALLGALFLYGYFESERRALANAEMEKKLHAAYVKEAERQQKRKAKKGDAPTAFDQAMAHYQEIQMQMEQYNKQQGKDELIVYKGGKQVKARKDAKGKLKIEE